MSTVDTPSIEVADNNEDVTSRETLMLVARKMLKRLMDDNETKATFAEYLKILQLIKETGDDSPGEITVRWVEPNWADDDED